MAGALNYRGQRRNGAELIGKDKVMWVFDGEEWTQDDGSESSKAQKPEMTWPRYDELVPELQVIEVVIPRKRNTDVPPLPMP